MREWLRNHSLVLPSVAATIRDGSRDAQILYRREFFEEEEDEGLLPKGHHYVLPHEWGSFDSENQDWMNEAACRDADGSIFYAGKLEGGFAHRDEAFSFCALCPVREDCLNYAMEVGDLHGIFGGMTPRQRRRIKRGTRRVEVEAEIEEAKIIRLEKARKRKEEKETKEREDAENWEKYVTSRRNELAEAKERKLRKKTEDAEAEFWRNYAEWQESLGPTHGTLTEVPEQA